MENSSLFGITYNDWRNCVGTYLEQGQTYLKNHIYSYPLSKITMEDRKRLLSEEFFNSYIASGLFLNDNELKKYNTVDPKNNGDLRNITLISPIMYLIIITIGGHLAKQNHYFNEKDWINYAGNYKKGVMSYAPAYKDFSLAALGLQSSYKYYLKTDITSFYPMLNMGILFNEIQSVCENESARSLMFYRSLLEYFGDGRYPVVSDNIGLSYIATAIYLKKFDELFIGRVDKDPLISDYQILRYVDDFYIAFNCKKGVYDKTISHLKRYLQEVASKMQLKLNFQKQKVSETANISDDIYANVYDYMVNDENIGYSDRYNEKQIVNLINALLELKFYPDHGDVEKIIIDVLDDHEYGFYYTEVLNWYIYKNKAIFREKVIIDGLNQLLERIDILEHYPKQFGRMIINTCDDSLIKKYLNKIFNLFRVTPTPRFIEFLAKEYLLEHNFKHKDLKGYIGENSPELYQYIKCYCEGNYHIPSLKRYKDIYLRKMINDPILPYLWFMHRCAKNESRILESFAYYKNYFDRKFAYFMATMREEGATNKKGKVSFQQSYKIRIVKNTLKRWKDKGLNYTEKDEKKLSKIENARHDNPVVHASSKLLYENDKTILELKSHIQFLDSILEKVEDFVISRVEY